MRFVTPNFAMRVQLFSFIIIIFLFPTFNSVNSIYLTTMLSSNVEQMTDLKLVPNKFIYDTVYSLQSTIIFLSILCHGASICSQKATFNQRC